ncbi:MAG: agmatine deiminase family protein [Bacteroidia bacterium]|nr:agmatine deiminase family protein [Bacteroidia bacterium]
MLRFPAILVLCFLFLFGPDTYAQVSDLPRGFAPKEKSFIRRYLSSRTKNAQGISVPPEFPVRAMAEWEEIEYLVIAWVQYLPTLREIVRYSREECKVVILCSDTTGVKMFLTEGDVSLEGVILIPTPVNSVWIRDYGASSVYTHGVDSLWLVDWIYNRPRPDDDYIPSVLSRYLRKSLFSTTRPPFDLVHTGGNFMSDGMGTGFSSRLILDENSASGQFNLSIKNEAEVNEVMRRFMGINRYIKMDVLPYDGIHHIDMHMKLLNEETLLVGKYPTGVADGPQIEENMEYLLSSFSSGFGFPYELARIPMPPHHGDYPDSWWANYRTYTNSVFVNKTVLVPVYEEKYDTTALRIYRQLLPGYRVVGINCNAIIRSGGALHCITKGIGVSDPLLIQHRRLRDRFVTYNSYQVNALISHRSGIRSAQIYFTTDTTAGFTPIEMIEAIPEENVWTGFIPPHPPGTTLYYYIHAESFSGKQINRPITAPAGWWKFRVLSRPDPSLR